MENGKSPGIDGLPIEFYKSQYELIKNDLLQLYSSIFFLNRKPYTLNEPSNYHLNTRK